MAIVYIHRNPKTMEPFYVGIGKRKHRCNSRKGRSKFWKNYVNKYGLFKQILVQDISYDDAKELEVLLISIYGRLNNNTGCLVNLTDGGEGSSGYIASKETREKLSKSSKRLVGEKNGMFGKTLSKEARNKISLANKNKVVTKKTRLKMSYAQKRQSDPIIYKGVKYLSVRDANRITGESRYTINKNAIRVS